MQIFKKKVSENRYKIHWLLWWNFKKRHILKIGMHEKNLFLKLLIESKQLAMA